eukprot:scaffold40827_cov88-Cyclotella_meneghiniana.AAC.5
MDAHRRGCKAVVPVKAVLIILSSLWIAATVFIISFHNSMVSLKHDASKNHPQVIVSEASSTIWRYKNALTRLDKLKASGIVHEATCPITLFIGFRQPLGPHFIGNRCEPWWVRSAIFLIHHIILPYWKVLEWGGGSSTVWFSSQVESVTTIEDSEGFVGVLKEKFELHKIYPTLTYATLTGKRI